MPGNRQKKKMMQLVSAMKKCRVTRGSASGERRTPRGSVLSAVADPARANLWPQLKMDTPPIFLHRDDCFQAFKDGAKDMARSGIKFYYPKAMQFYLQFKLPSDDDHRAMARYFDRKKWPYHTYGFPNKKKIKIMITGLPIDTDVDIVKEELKKLGVAVVRMNRLHTRDDSVRPLIIMVVVPHALDGQLILKVKKILGHDVILERPKPKPKQCYRCQRWGHSQRYCHGIYRCVKCAEPHYYKKCTKKRKKPAKCANCKGTHTSNFKNCPHCPLSEAYQRNLRLKLAAFTVAGRPTAPQEKKLLSADLLKNNAGSIIIMQKKVILQGPAPRVFPQANPRRGLQTLGDEDVLYTDSEGEYYYTSDVDAGDLVM